MASSEQQKEEEIKPVTPGWKKYYSSGDWARIAGSSYRGKNHPLAKSKAKQRWQSPHAQGEPYYSDEAKDVELFLPIPPLPGIPIPHGVCGQPNVVSSYLLTDLPPSHNKSSDH